MITILSFLLEYPKSVLKYSIDVFGDTVLELPDLMKIRYYRLKSDDFFVTKTELLPIYGDVIEYDMCADEWFIVKDINKNGEIECRT